jgi:hypothetical protein
MTTMTTTTTTTTTVTMTMTTTMTTPHEAVAEYVSRSGVRPLRYDERADAEALVAAGVPVDVAVHRAHYRSQTPTR